MSRTKSFRRRRFKPQVLYAIVIALAGIGIVVGLQTDQWKKIVSGYRAQDGTEEPADPNGDTVDIDEFELYLKSASDQQLIIRSSELLDDNQKDMLERLEDQRKKIRIADELLTRNRNVRATEFGISSRLTALQTREWINFDYGLSNAEQIDELLNFSVKHALSENDKSKRSAQQGRLTARIIRYLRNVEAGETGSVDALVKEFQTMCEQNVDDSDTMLFLFSCLKRIHLRAEPDVFRKFLDVFQNVYRNSEIELLRQIAENAAGQIIMSEFELVDVFAEPGVKQDELVNQLEAQLQNALSLGDISQQGYTRILAAILSLSRLGRYDAALELSDRLRRKIAHDDVYQPLLDEISFRRQQWNLVGKPFSFEGLTTLEGEPLSPGNPDARVKAILLLTPDTMRVSQSAISYILKNASGYVKTGKFSLTTILVDSGDDPESKLEMVKMASLVPVVQFGLLDSESEDGKKMLERLAFRKPPVLLMLDQDDYLIAIDVQADDFENRLSRLVSDY